MRNMLVVIDSCFSFLKQKYNVEIDYRVLVVQNTNSTYNIKAGNYEKFAMPLNSSLNARNFIDKFLTGYSKNLTSEQLYTLQNSLVGGHVRSLCLALEYMREWCSHDQIPQFIQEISSFNETTDVYMLFIERIRAIIGEDKLRKLLGLVSIFPYGLSQAYLQDLTGISNNIDFYTVWSCLSKLTVEDDEGAIYWPNDFIAQYFCDTFNLDDTEFKRELAKECAQHIGKRIKNLITPEKLYDQINEGPLWLFLNDFTTSFPPKIRAEYREKYWPLRMKVDDFSRSLYQMRVCLFLKDKGCLQFDYIKEHFYPAKVSNLIRAYMERLWFESKKQKDHGDLENFMDEAVSAANTYEYIDRYRWPYQWEVLCYLGSLAICREWEQLEAELIKPEIVNYVWQTSVLIDCWNRAIWEGGKSIVQPVAQNNNLIRNKMLYISYAISSSGNPSGMSGVRFYGGM